jgi:hypothetical protein
VYLTWLIPAWLLFLGVYQANVMRGLISTHADGTDLMAFVEEFDIKYISSQTNGYVILRFTPPGEAQRVEKLGLPVQVAAKIQNLAAIPIRYQPDSSVPVVMLPTFPFQRSTMIVNLAIMAVSLLITSLIAWHFTSSRPR